MRVVKGDLLALANTGHFDVIFHGCNCFRTWGAGIALQMKQKFPEAYLADLKTKRGDLKKLGTISYAPCLRDGLQIHVVNLYLQYGYKGIRDRECSQFLLSFGTQIDYEAFRQALKLMKEKFGGQQHRFGFPLVGCGYAGAWEETILKLIEYDLQGEDLTLVRWKRP